MTDQGSSRLGKREETRCPMLCAAEVILFEHAVERGNYRLANPNGK